MKQNERPKSTRADIVTAAASVVGALAAKNAAEAAKALVHLKEQENRASTLHYEKMQRIQERTNRKLEDDAAEAKWDRQEALELQKEIASAAREDAAIARSAEEDSRNQDALDRKLKVWRQLMSAAKNGDTQMLDQILSAGIVCVDDSYNGRDALISAAESGLGEMIHHIWKKRDAKMGKSLELLFSYEGDYFSACKALLTTITFNKEEDVIPLNILETSVNSDRRDLFPLLFLAKKWPAPVLVDAGRIAYQNCDFSTVKLIRESGIGLTELVQNTESKLNSFVRTVSKGQWDLVTEMVNFDREVLKIKQSEGLTPLLYFAKTGNEDACLKLIKLGADESEVDGTGNGWRSILENFMAHERTTADIVNQKTGEFKIKETKLSCAVAHAEREYSDLIAQKACIVEGIKTDINRSTQLYNQGAHYVKLYGFASSILMMVIPLFFLGAGFKANVVGSLSAYSFVAFSFKLCPILGIWFGAGVLIARLIADQNLIKGIAHGLLSFIYLPATAWLLWSLAHLLSYTIGFFEDKAAIAKAAVGYLDSINSPAGIVASSGIALALTMAYCLRQVKSCQSAGILGKMIFDVRGQNNDVHSLKTRLKEVLDLYELKLAHSFETLKDGSFSHKSASKDEYRKGSEWREIRQGQLKSWSEKDADKIVDKAYSFLADLIHAWQNLEKAKRLLVSHRRETTQKINEIKTSFIRSTSGELASNETGALEDSHDCQDTTEKSLYERAIDVVKSNKRASTSMIQRRLRIKYDDAARLMDRMEQDGIVGPENGSSPREILIDLD